MICVSHITDCMSKIDFVKCDREERVEMIKNVYEKSIEKSINKDWIKNWEISLPLVDELVDMKFQLTKLLYTETTRGKERNTVQYINLEPVKRNPEFVKQVMALQSIWDSRNNLYMAKLARVGNEAVENNVKLFYERKKLESKGPDYSIVTNEEIRFLWVDNCLPEMNSGGVNMRTGTTIIEALIY